MRGSDLLVVIVLSLAWFPSTASGQSAPVVNTYDGCITRHAAKAPSTQAAVILQRACFYKYRYGKDRVANFGTEPEHKKLAKIYTPAVCDCIFDKMPGAPSHLPATRVLDDCVTASRKPREPSSR
ncbi:MAG TPA: hypothetical protein VLT56_08740 [Desulfobacterales bacterium]|jgi:hypothetical protein|nr:hypothetical protein [Desulfobacterales bacterium]HSM90098.1 hypothetical protein [Desulfobacterales bacterium]